MKIINYNALIIFFAIIIAILFFVIRSKNSSIQLLKGKLKNSESNAEKTLNEYNLISKQLSDCQGQLSTLQNEICEQADMQFSLVMRDFAKHSPFSKSAVFSSLASDYIASDERFMNAFTDSTMTLLSVPEISARVKGHTGEVYNVTLNSCTCIDFQFRKKPCKHMYRLAIHIGALSYVNTYKVECCLNKYISESNNAASELRMIEQSIKKEQANLKNKKDKIENQATAIKQKRAELFSFQEKCYTSFLSKLKAEGYNPAWLSNMYGDYYDMFTDKLLLDLTSKVRPAYTTAANIEKKYKEEMRSLAVSSKYYESLVNLYESFYPNLSLLCDMNCDDNICNLVEADDEITKTEYESMRNWISRADYDLLPTSEKYQLALDNYKHRKRSNWEAGRDFERYIGYLYEVGGYKVNYFGALNGLEDLGRDLYAQKGSDLIIIQCKRWSSSKLIHEKHVYQLFGSITDYRINNPGVSVTGLIISTCALSDMARKVADCLSIDYKENFSFPDYPLIKCNINQRTRERIYHLPFDQQYDRISIETGCGEFYAWTVKEAEKNGFRRAKKYNLNSTTE